MYAPAYYGRGALVDVNTTGERSRRSDDSPVAATSKLPPLGPYLHHRPIFSIPNPSFFLPFVATRTFFAVRASTNRSNHGGEHGRRCDGGRAAETRERGGEDSRW